MGFVGNVRIASALFAVATLATGCLETSDPSAPCTAMNLAEPVGATRLAPATAPIVAMSGRDETSSVALYPVCEPDGSCTLREARLAPNDDPARSVTPGSAVLVSSAGGYVVSIDRTTGKVHNWRVEHGELKANADAPVQLGIIRLVAGLRGSDHVLVRDRDGNLRIWLPGAPTARILADKFTYLLAVGEEHLVTRTLVDGTEDIVQVIDAFGDTPEPTPILRASHLQRVAIAPGDSTIAITMGTKNPETLVFSVPSLELTDRFEGRLASGRSQLDDIPGLTAHSPDGTHLAYRTDSGALALRDLPTAGSCLVRSATHGDHEVAGFSADGLLFTESHESGHANAVRSRVLAFDPSTRRMAGLGEPAEGYHLAAVPSRADPQVGPWAVGVSDGVHFGLAEGDNASFLSLDEAGFLARDDGAVWAVEAADGPAGGDADRVIRVRSITPTPNPDGSVGFATDGALAYPHHYAPDGDGGLVDMGPFRHSIDGAPWICLSTGMPGGWAYRCGHSSDQNLLRNPTPPSSEDPYNDTPEPEIPDPPSDEG